MAIKIDNHSNKISLGDSTLSWKGSLALSMNSSLDLSGVTIVGEGNGITFPDSSVQTTAATPYTLPTASASNLGGVKVGSGLNIDGNGVLSSAGGSSGITDIYNNTARYQLVTTSNQTVWCVSTSSVKGGISWTRSGSELTLHKTSHGHSTGERVIVRNTNVDYQVAIISNVTTDTFTIPCTDIGATSGSLGAYLLGFTYSHNSSTPGSISSGTLTAPSGGDLQLLSLRIHFGPNTRAGNTYNLVVPASAINGAGSDTSMDDIYIPIQNVRQDGANLAAVGNTIATNISGSYATFQFAALPIVATGIHILMSF